MGALAQRKSERKQGILDGVRSFEPSLCPWHSNSMSNRKNRRPKGRRRRASSPWATLALVGLAVVLVFIAYDAARARAQLRTELARVQERFVELQSGRDIDANVPTESIDGAEHPAPDDVVALALHAYPIPDEVTFCGERLPLEDPTVYGRFEDEWNRFLVNRHWVVSWMRRSRSAYPPVEAKLARAGLPDDLKYVMTIESSINPRATSSAGAVGYWQFIGGTGTQYGLRRNSTIDERRDLDRATDAAIAYLTELHEEFGAWTLALSAYNAGERRISSCIEAQGTQDYYALNLPTETEAYWFKAAAVKVLFENPERYGFLLPDDGWQPVACDTLRVDVSSTHMMLREICEVAGISYRELKSHNPWLRASYLPRGDNKLVLPKDASARVLAAFEEANLVGEAPKLELAETMVDEKSAAEAEPSEDLDISSPANAAPWH